MDYLIPANSKKSMLLLGMFRMFDLILFVSGVGLSLLLLVLFNPSTFWLAMIDLAPGLICGFLVMPIPHYHNMRVVLMDIYWFYTNRQRFIWKGWCASGEESNTKTNAK